jgi:predicted metal-dependent hydrolase
MRGIEIEVRPRRFEIDASIPRYWHGNRRSVTTFFDNLSVFFPAGERFFIQSVRAYEEQVKGERLATDVRAFCGQEGAHSREHARYNAWLRGHGCPIEPLERRVAENLQGASRRVPKRLCLAVTCALEHFTALMGLALLEDPRVLEGAHPVMADLWRWHAAEENEHKSVAYDVHVAAGGTYLERAIAMSVVTIMFWQHVLAHQVRLTRADGTLWSLREWAALVGWLFVRPGAMWRVIRRYLHYYRPGFHPSDIDSRSVIDAWQREYGASSPPREALP